MGSLDDVGLMQIRAKYSKYTKKELLNPKTNIKEAIRILTEAKNKCKFKNNYSWVICYNRGVTGAKKVINYKQDIYYKKVMSNYAKIKGEIYGKNNSYTLQSK